MTHRQGQLWHIAAGTVMIAALVIAMVLVLA
jgi:hypothetical protein